VRLGCFEAWEGHFVFGCSVVARFVFGRFVGVPNFELFEFFVQKKNVANKNYWLMHYCTYFVVENF
jgi:hypothetical protein